MSKLLFDKENKSRPYLAVNAVILKKINNKQYILLGKRKNGAGAGYYYPPGGHVKWGESLKETLIREVKEECGLDILPGKSVWTEEAFEPEHHVILYYYAIFKNKSDKPKNVEPDKCEGWHWFPLDCPPTPLWHYLGELIKLLNKKFKPKERS